MFDKIKAADLNDYLKSMSPEVPDLSAKVFRTYNASKTLQEELGREELKIGDIDEKTKYYENANRQVAILCNHQKAVPKNFEENLEKAKLKLKEKEDKITELKD